MALQGVLPNKCFQDIPEIPQVVRMRGSYVFDEVDAGETSEYTVPVTGIDESTLANCVVIVTPVITGSETFDPSVMVYGYINYGSSNFTIGIKNNGTTTSAAFEVSYILV